MKKPVFLLRLALCCTFLMLFSEASGQSKKKADVLKVMTYNVHHCNPPSQPEGTIDIEAIARVINKEKPDLVALQEVDVNTERSGKGKNQAALLAGLTGMHYFFSKAIDHQGGDYGVAVLSRFEILDSLRLPLPLPDGVSGEPRTVAAVKVRLKGRKQAWFASTHLDLKEVTRLFQAELIIRRFSDSKVPVILAGDFNAVPGSREINLLDRHFTRTCMNDCQPTSPQINPRNVIDFIMFTPSRRFQVLRTNVPVETYASDHLPVVSELRIK